MKKIIAVLLAAACIFLSACNSDEPEITTAATTSSPKTADMLNIDSNEKVYTACMNRYYAVINAVKNKVQILEAEYNKTIENEVPEKFFLDERYIMTLFDPFILNDFALTEQFNGYMDSKKAAEAYSAVSNGAEIRFESNSSNRYVLKFVTEQTTKEITVDYNSKDAFKYISETESNDSVMLNEMLEFCKISNNTYLIQSKSTRLYVQFDSKGNIISFRCATLKNGAYGTNDSVFPQANVGAEWVTDRDKNEYLNVHSYENGVLTHEDSSSGPWKTVTVNESDFANAFPLQ